MSGPLYKNAKWLRRYKRKGWSNRRIAEAASCSPGTVSKWLRHFSIASSQPAKRGAGKSEAREKSKEMSEWQKTIIIPVIWAGVASGLAGVIVWRLTDWDPIAAGAIVAIVVWLAALVSNFGLERLERLTGMDWNKDGYIGGQPDRPSRPVPQAARQTDAEILLAAIQEGRSPAEKSWVPDPFSRKQYTAARDRLLVDGMIEWKNAKAHGAGLQLTARGGAQHEARVYQCGRESTILV